MSSRIEHELQRGALVNVLGTLGKIAGPAFLVFVTRLYGADVFGVFVTATAFVEAGLAFLTAGFKDGALISVARHADFEDERGRLYHLLSNALGWSLLFALLLVVLTFALGPWLFPLLFDAYGARLDGMMRWMVLALPLLAFDRTVIAATQGLKIMKYDALVNGGARPVLLLASAAAFWLWMPTTTGLALAYLTTQLALGAVALGIYSRELAWRPLLRAIRRFEIDRELMAFALPQNLNMTLERFLTNIDIVMLGMLGFGAATTGFYGAGSMIVRELLSIKQIFSNAFAPHIVRLHRAGNAERLSAAFSTTSRWIATLAVPVILAVAVLRTDVLGVVSPAFADDPAWFMLALLPVPYLQCGFSLAGNVVVMTGHSRLNLLNSAVTGTANTLLNLWLIPLFGLVGAALASTLATLVKMVMEVTEAWMVARVRLVLEQVYAPHVAGIVAGGGLVAAFAWLPVTTFAHRLALLAGALAVYVAALSLFLGRLPRLPLRSTPTPVRE